MAFQADYHVHHHLDVCAHESMTLPNIDAATHEMGLSEISVLAHCSAMLPGGRRDWGSWHLFDGEKFEKYLSEMNAFTSRFGTRIYSGVETELWSEDGQIAVTEYVEKNVDMIQLSLHYMPALPIFPWLPREFPIRPKTEENFAEQARWREAIRDIRTEDILSCIVNAHINAVRKNKKVRSLAHFNDMSYTPEIYGISFEGLSDDTLIEIFEPLMKTVSENEVLWELTDECPIRKKFFARAKELGVKFSPTADAHFITGSWGPLCRRNGAVERMQALGLEGSHIVIR